MQNFLKFKLISVVIFYEMKILNSTVCFFWKKSAGFCKFIEKLCLGAMQQKKKVGFHRKYVVDRSE